MKIYLAGASSERDMIRGYRDRLIAAGHRIRDVPGDESQLPLAPESEPAR